MQDGRIHILLQQAVAAAADVDIAVRLPFEVRHLRHLADVEVVRARVARAATRHADDSRLAVRALQDDSDLLV